MNGKIKKNKGFIRMPLMATIIIAVIIVGGVGYFGFAQYSDYREQKIEEKKKDNETQDLIAQQREVLEKARQEIEKLKQESTEVKKSQILLEQRISESEKENPNNLFITVHEVEPYFTGIGEIICFGQSQKGGSASIWDIGGNLGHIALTNMHVISGSGNCNLILQDSSTDTTHSGVYRLDKSFIYNWNSDTDIAAVKITYLESSVYSVPTLITNLNYRISDLRRCPVEMPLGSPVVVIGYPVFAKTSVVVGGEVASQSFRTITNGIISAHDTSIQKPVGNLPYSNYFVSAKIDSGSSGGIAFSKDGNGLCVLGVPTWLSLGIYETQGLIQNIHNVMYIK